MEDIDSTSLFYQKILIGFISLLVSLIFGLLPSYLSWSPPPLPHLPPVTLSSKASTRSTPSLRSTTKKEQEIEAAPQCNDGPAAAHSHEAAQHGHEHNAQHVDHKHTHDHHDLAHTHQHTLTPSTTSSRSRSTIKKEQEIEAAPQCQDGLAAAWAAQSAQATHSHEGAQHGREHHSQHVDHQHIHEHAEHTQHEHIHDHTHTHYHLHHAPHTHSNQPMLPPWLSLATSFGGGVFLGAALLHLLPEASEVLDGDFRELGVQAHVNVGNYDSYGNFKGYESYESLGSNDSHSFNSDSSQNSYKFLNYWNQLHNSWSATLSREFPRANLICALGFLMVLALEEYVGSVTGGDVGGGGHAGDVGDVGNASDVGNAGGAGDKAGQTEFFHEPISESEKNKNNLYPSSSITNRKKKKSVSLNLPEETDSAELIASNTKTKNYGSLLSNTKFDKGFRSQMKSSSANSAQRSSSTASSTTPPLASSSSPSSSPNSTNSSTSSPNTSAHSSSLALVTALSTHSLFDGLAIGSVTSFSQLQAVSVAVLAHKPISAFALGSILLGKRILFLESLEREEVEGELKEEGMEEVEQMKDEDDVVEEFENEVNHDELEDLLEDRKYMEEAENHAPKEREILVSDKLRRSTGSTRPTRPTRLTRSTRSSSGNVSRFSLLPLHSIRSFRQSFQRQRSHPSDPTGPFDQSNTSDPANRSSSFSMRNIPSSFRNLRNITTSFTSSLTHTDEETQRDIALQLRKDLQRRKSLPGRTSMYYYFKYSPYSCCDVAATGKGGGGNGRIRRSSIKIKKNATKDVDDVGSCANGSVICGNYECRYNEWNHSLRRSIEELQELEELEELEREEKKEVEEVKDETWANEPHEPHEPHEPQEPHNEEEQEKETEDAKIHPPLDVERGGGSGRAKKSMKRARTPLETSTTRSVSHEPTLWRCQTWERISNISLSIVLYMVMFSSSGMLGTMLGAWGLSMLEAGETEEAGVPGVPGEELDHEFDSRRILESQSTSPTHPSKGEIVAALCQSLAAGTFLYAATMEALAKEEDGGHHHHGHHGGGGSVGSVGSGHHGHGGHSGHHSHHHHPPPRTKRLFAALLGVIAMAAIKLLEPEDED